VDVLLIPATEDSDPKTWVLATKKSKVYVAAIRGTISASALESVDPSTWSFVPPQKVDPANLYPIAKPSYHRFRYRKGEAHNEVFKKHHSPLEVATSHKGLEQLGDEHTALVTRREVVTCELLREHPHHNIAEYRGVICSDKLTFDHPSGSVDVPFDTERVLKLVFKRYDCTLWDLVVHHQVVNLKQCLQSIAADISHMHSLGLVHGDIKPKNIFLSAEDGKDPEQSLH
jgi:serine/threonine protein kinase